MPPPKHRDDRVLVARTSLRRWRSVLAITNGVIRERRPQDEDLQRLLPEIAAACRELAELDPVEFPDDEVTPSCPSPADAERAFQASRRHSERAMIALRKKP